MPREVVEGWEAVKTIFTGDNSLNWPLGSSPFDIFNQVLAGDFSALGVPTLGQLTGPIMDATPGNNSTTAANKGFTLQLGLGLNWNLGPFAGSWFFGVAVDSHGHVAGYAGGGGGLGTGGAASVGVQLAGSNGNSVCALGGPFTNVSGTAGYELAGTGDYFQGAGDGPGGIVQGGGVTLGGGGGAGGSVQVTGTTVSPIGHSCVNGKIQ